LTTGKFRTETLIFLKYAQILGNDFIANEIKFCVWLPRPKVGEAKSSTTIFVVYCTNISLAGFFYVYVEDNIDKELRFRFIALFVRLIAHIDAYFFGVMQNACIDKFTWNFCFFGRRRAVFEKSQRNSLAHCG